MYMLLLVVHGMYFLVGIVSEDVVMVCHQVVKCFSCVLNLINLALYIFILYSCTIGTWLSYQKMI